MSPRLLLLAALLSACGTTRQSPEVEVGAPTSAASTTAPESAASGSARLAGVLPPGLVSRAAMPGTSLLVMSRPLVTRLAAGDPLRLALHWQTEAGPMSPAAFPQQLELQKTLETLRFTIAGPSGRAELSASWTDALPKRYPSPLHHRPTLFLSLSGAGPSEAEGFDGAWRGTAPVLSTPGEYRITVEGALVFTDSPPLSFQSAEIVMEVGAPGVVPLAELERAAAAERAKKAPTASWVKRGVSTESGFVPGVVIEDGSGNRVVYAAEQPPRFGYTLHASTFTPSGELLSHKTFSIGTCIGAGTLIEAERGLVPIEEIALGERVWGYDPEAGRRVLTAVVALRVGASERLLELGALRVTPEHPVYVDGEWRLAGEIRAGSRLLSSSLSWTAAPEAVAVFGLSPIFDLTVEAPHSFFAGGVLVHNKDRGYMSALDDPWYFMWSPEGAGIE